MEVDEAIPDAEIAVGYDTQLSTLPLDDDTPAILPLPESVVTNGFLRAVENVDNQIQYLELVRSTTYTIGRRPGSSIKMENQYVSKEHCTISLNGNGEAFLTNHSVVNGTIINGTTLKETDAPHRLYDGDEITVVPNTLKTPLCVFNYEHDRFPPGRLLGNRYRLSADATALLGEGNFGVVYKAVDRVSLRAVAVKILRNPAELAHEVQIMRGLDHPAVTKVVEYMEEEGVGYIIMELLAGGDLFDRWSAEPYTYTEDQMREITRRLVGAIAYLHEKGIARTCRRQQT